MATPNSFAELIEQWPSVADFARETDQPYERAKQWRARDSIPPEHWPQVILAAAGRGHLVSADLFMKWAADARPSKESAA